MIYEQQKVPINKLPQPIELYGGQASDTQPCEFKQQLCFMYIFDLCKQFITDLPKYMKNNVYAQFYIIPQFESGHRLILYFLQAVCVIIFACLLVRFLATYRVNN